jgi:hypothetical protein
MNYEIDPNSEYTGIALAGSIIARCDMAMLLILHENNVYEIGEHYIKRKMSLDDYQDYSEHGYLTPFDNHRPKVKMGDIAFYMKMDMYNKIAEKIDLSSPNILEVYITSRNLKVFLGNKDAIISFRKRCCERLLDHIRSSMIDRYILEKGVMEKDEEIKLLNEINDFASQGRFIASYLDEKLRGHYYDFSVMAGVARSWMGETAWVDRNYYLHIEPYFSDITYEKYKLDVDNILKIS